MYHNAEKIIINQDLISMDKQPKQELIKELRKCNSVGVKMFYFQVLNQVKDCIENGDVSLLLKSNNLLIDMECKISALTYLTYRYSPDNPLRNMNIITLACQYNQPEILNFLFSNACKILQHWPITFCSTNCVSPTDIDEYQHNAFYYAIRSGNTELLKVLLEKWPDNSSFKNSYMMHETLRGAYRELKLKNVELSFEMEFFVRREFFKKDFYPPLEVQTDGEQPKETVLKRVLLVLDECKGLINEYSNKDVDDKFLVVAKFIGKNIHILKRQLKSTYDTVPWEEVEFCLVIFILSETELEENILLHARCLNKNRLLLHLKNFADSLETTITLINEGSESSLRKPPNLQQLGGNIRDICEKRIVQMNPSFENLYIDYYLVRDEYSLKNMKRYLDRATAVECDGEGKLVISRALQVVGEHLKNTLDSPKLSDTTCGLLLLFCPKDTDEIIKGLRNALSHADSMSKRIEIEKANENLFRDIQEDLKKLHGAIVEMLCRRKIRFIRNILKEIDECGNEMKLKEILKSMPFVKVEEEFTEIPEISQLLILETEVRELEKAMKVDTQEEEKLFIEINKKINFEKNRLHKTFTNTVKILKSYTHFIHFYRLIYTSQQSKLKMVKNDVKQLLENSAPDIEWSRVNEILTLLEKIKTIIQSKFIGKELDKILNIHFKPFFSALFYLRNMKLIEEYKCNILINKVKGNKQIKSRTVSISNLSESTDKLLYYNLDQLRNTLDKNTFMTDLKDRMAVEMLTLDIFSLQDKYLSYNHLFLDDDPVTLIGRNLRNYLAHENILMQVLSTSSLIDLQLNAQTISENYIPCQGRTIGKTFQSNINKLEEEHKKDLRIVTIQQELFDALPKGNLARVKRCIRKGADRNAKNMKHKTSLHLACEGASIDIIKFVLNEKCDIEARDSRGQTAIHISALHGRSNIVEYLIDEAKVSANQLNKCNQTPLHIAAEHGHLDVVKTLVDLKACPKLQDISGYSPLHYAIMNNHIKIVEILMEMEDNVDENQATRGITPLHIAAHNGHLELVNYLIEKKANVNAEDDLLHVPLYFAAQTNCLEIALSLIANGAKVESRDLFGVTGLHVACFTGKKNIIQMLLDNGLHVDDINNIYKRSPLQYAAEKGNFEAVELLTNHNAKVDIRDLFGKSALHLASEMGHLDVVEVLLKNKSSLEVRDIQGYTALHYGAINGHESVVRLLIKTGSNINCEDKCKNTPLHLAAKNGHHEVVKVLIHEKADINIANIINSTALHECSENIHTDVAKMLIEYQADIHAKCLEFKITPFQYALGMGSIDLLQAFENGGGNVKDIKTTHFTALHLAIINGDENFIQYLIDKKCDVNAKSKSGLTPMHLAVEQNNRSIIEILIKKSANLNIRDKNGVTPLHIAVGQNNKKMVKYLIEKGATAKDKGQGEPLASAVINGFHEVVNILIERGRFDVNVKLANNSSLLMTSILYHHNKVTEILLEKGADVNLISNDTTPLHLASWYGDLGTVKLLLEKGADPNVEIRTEKITPLYIGIQKGHVDVVDVLLKHGATKVDSTNKSALHLAVEFSEIQVVKFLLQQIDLDINKKINDDFTLLHVAAKINKVELVKCLVEKGADINIKDETHNDEPIIWAVKLGHEDVVEFLHTFSEDNSFLNVGALSESILRGQLKVAKYLVDSSVDLNSWINGGETFLHFASRLNQKDMVLYMLEKGAYYNAKNINGDTPIQVTKNSDINSTLTLIQQLFNSIRRNMRYLLQTSIEKGAILNAKRKDDLSLLHYAAYKGNCDIVNDLLMNGANPNIEGRGKSTPLHYASQYGNLNTVRSLLSHGAIHDFQSGTGKTPLEYSRQLEIIELLSLIQTSFKGVLNGDVGFLETLKNLREIESVRSVMKTRNKDNKLLITLAIRNDFPKVKQLKQLLEEDLTSIYSEATEYNRHGKYSESLKLFKDVLKTKEDYFLHDHPDTMDIKDKIGEALLGQFDFDNAVKTLSENYETRKVTLGANNAFTMRTKMQMAVALYHFGQKEEALKYLQDIYNKQWKFFGKSHFDVLKTQINIAKVLQQDHKDLEALKQYEVVDELRKEFCSEDIRMLIDVQANMAMILSKQNKHEDALEKLNFLYATIKEIPKEEHLYSLEIISNMAHVYLRKGCFNISLKLYKHVLGLQKITFGKESLWFLQTLNSIANVLLSQRKFAESFKTFSKCCIMGSNIMGPKHPIVQNSHDMKEQIKSHLSSVSKEGKVISCILEQIEKDFGDTEVQNVASQEQNLQRASDLYFQRKIPSMLYPLTQFMSEEDVRHFPEITITSEHFIRLFSEMSRFRAIANGYHNFETGNNFHDRDVFYWMVTSKKILSGIHIKYDDIDGSDDIFPLYKVSYMWFSAIGCGSTMLIGYIASLILNHKRGEVAEVPMELLSPMAKHFMKKEEDFKDKKGMTTVESIAIEKLPPPATKVDADVQTTNSASEDTAKERY